jgi:hypothetical protein
MASKAQLLTLKAKAERADYMIGCEELARQRLRRSVYCPRRASAQVFDVKSVGVGSAKSRSLANPYSVLGGGVRDTTSISVQDPK